MEIVLTTGLATGLGLHQLFKRYEPAGIPEAGLKIGAAIAIIASLLSRATPTLSLATIVSALCATTIAALLLSITIYRLGPWHPLAQYPGPTLHKLTKIRVAWSSWRGTHYKEMADLHKKYGPIVRMAPNAVSIVDVAAVSSVYGANGLPKDRYYRSRRLRDNPPLISMTGLDHAHRRQLWNRGLGRSALSTHTVHAASGWERLRVQFDKAAEDDRVVDMSTWLRFYSFDFMGNFAFGNEFGLVEAGIDQRGAWPTIQQFVIATDLVGHLPWLGTRAAFIPGISEKISNLRKFARTCVDDRLKRHATTLDLWYYLGSEAEGGATTPPLRIDQQAAEGALALVAGADTSATAMISTLYLLLSNPSCLAKARKEVDETASNGLAPWANSECHSSLPYLAACIDESLRLLPVVPTNGSRGVPPGSGGKTISSHFIPEETEVFVAPYQLHRDPRYFSPESDVFRPERWLEPDKWNTVKEAFIPFSMGPAQCVGKALAKIEIVLVLSGLLHYYDMEFAKGYNSDNFVKDLKEHVVLDVPSLPVLMKSRM